jgi:hypothetical protein
MLVLAGSSAASAPTEVSSFPVEGRHILSVALGKQLLHPCARSVPAGVKIFWVSSQADIDILEQRLVVYMAALEKVQSVWPPAGPFDRHYMGIVVKGTRLIYGNFYPTGISS